MSLYSRLSRSLRDVLTNIERLGDASAGFRSLTETIDTTPPRRENDDADGRTAPGGTDSLFAKRVTVQRAPFAGSVISTLWERLELRRPAASFILILE